MIRGGFELWARLLEMDTRPGNAPGDDAKFIADQARRAVMVDLCPIVDAAEASFLEVVDWVMANHKTAGFESDLHPTLAWTHDHQLEQPFPVTLFWWRNKALGRTPDGTTKKEWAVFGVLSILDGLKKLPCGWLDNSADLNVAEGFQLSEGTMTRMSFIEKYGRATMACTNVRTIDAASAPAWKREASNRSYPMVEWKTVVIPHSRTINHARKDSDREPSRESPRLHPVRRHWVTLPNGNRKQRGPFWRGDATKGVVLHDYVVEGAAMGGRELR